MPNVSPTGGGNPVGQSQFKPASESVKEVEMQLPASAGKQTSVSSIARNIESLKSNPLPDHLHKVIQGNEDGKLNAIKLATDANNIANSQTDAVDKVASSLIAQISRLRGG